MIFHNLTQQSFRVCAFALLTSSAIASDFPKKTIAYIVPFSPGGESDITAQMQAPLFEKLTGHGLSIKYIPGAGGAAGWSQLNNLVGDGHVIMGINLPHVVLQPLQKNAGYQTDDLTPLYWFHFTPDALLVPADSPIKNLKDYITTAKNRPGAVTLSGSGRNSANHFAQQQFDKLASIKTIYVPFNGTAQSNAALLNNHVNGSWAFTTAKIQMGERVRCIAVAMEQRHPILPTCPTFKELGFNFVSGAYRGVAVPKKTPPNVQAKIADLLSKINADPSFIKKMEDGGFAMINIGPDQMTDFMTEIKTYYGTPLK